ncbi:MAG: O-fucosyltransferase family protein [Congregibacter sp.]
MRQLFYTNYQSGNSGLSNGIMSIECGVVMAFLTKRFLLLDGNVSPPANIVSYDGRVDNSRPSRVTDLIDIPVPWAEPDPKEITELRCAELTSRHLMDSVFYMPDTVDLQSADALDFARGRSNWITEDDALADVSLLRVSESPVVPGSDVHRRNLSFYSYLFYLDDENRRAVYQMLSRMQAQEPFAALAQRVAGDLGNFNAVHMRRGDFKVTYGVTILDRSPWEAVEALDQHFSRDHRLLICTDERDDPFFAQVLEAWPDHVFIDHHILDNYASEFAALPRHDSLALAYLSQLVAAESMDFVGSMTSTFTAMIQRLRGNRGKREAFKFLWNELPAPGDSVERGSHPVSECVPLEDGIMVQQFEGRYSWNRYSQLINPAWMREWPESFLSARVLETGSLSPAQESRTDIRPPGRLHLNEYSAGSVTAYFQDLSVRIHSRQAGVLAALEDIFLQPADVTEGNVVEDLEIDYRGGSYLLNSRAGRIAEVREESALAGAIIDYLVPMLCRVRPGYSWFDGILLQQGEQTILFVGDWRAGNSGLPLTLTLRDAGWSLLGDEAVPVDAREASVTPFARCTATPGVAVAPCGLSAIVYGAQQLHSRTSLFALPPSVAVAELARTARDFALDRDRAIKRLCTLVEQVPAYQLSYAREDEVPTALSVLRDQVPASVEEVRA